MPAELRPGQLLDQLLQRADAAWQRHEGVRALEHDALSLMHVARDDQLLRVGKGPFPVGQKFRDDAGDPAALGERRRRDRPHQPDRPAAIDEADIVVGQDGAESRAPP